MQCKLIIGLGSDKRYNSNKNYMVFDILCRNSCCDCHNQMPSCLEQGQFSIFEKVKLQILQTGRRAVFLACTVAIFEKENKETLHILRCTFGWQSSCTCTLWFGGAGFDQRVVLKDKAIILEWKYAGGAWLSCSSSPGPFLQSLPSLCSLHMGSFQQLK